MRTPEPLYSRTLTRRPPASVQRPVERPVLRAEVLTEPPVIDVLIVVPERWAPALPPHAGEPVAVSPAARALASYVACAALPCPTGLLVRVRA